MSGISSYARTFFKVPTVPERWTKKDPREKKRLSRLITGSAAQVPCGTCAWSHPDSSSGQVSASRFPVGVLLEL